MDGTSNRAAGLESNDSSGQDDHRGRSRSRATHCVKTACEILEGSNRQETQQARVILEEALLHLEALGEG